jgi:uncharacterized DUF497 family protein
MKITYDPSKRERTLVRRQLDFDRFGEILSGRYFTLRDERMLYGEDRFITVGLLDGRMVVTVWTERDGAIRVISMRKTNEREQKKFGYRLG